MGVPSLRKRIWNVPRGRADADSIVTAASLIASSTRPFTLAGGVACGIQKLAHAVLAELRALGIPVGQTPAGKGSMPHRHPMDIGKVTTGTIAANTLASRADLIIGIGTRYSDFTTTHRRALPNESVRFLNVNAPTSTRSSWRGTPSSAMRAKPCSSSAMNWGTSLRARRIAARSTRHAPGATDRSAAIEADPPADLPRRSACSASSTTSSPTRMSSSTRPVRRPATPIGSGSRGRPRSTTWSTDSRRWAMRSRVHSA